MLGLYSLGSTAYSTRPAETRYGTVAINVTGTYEIGETKILQGGTGRIVVTGTVTTSAVRYRTPVGIAISGKASFQIGGTRRPSNIEFELTVNGTMTASSYRKGQEWTELGKGSETWTHIPNP